MTGERQEDEAARRLQHRFERMARLAREALLRPAPRRRIARPRQASEPAVRPALDRSRDEAR